MGEKLGRACTAPLRIAGREVGADIARADRAEHGIGNRMKRNVCIGVAGQALIVRNLDPAQPQLLARLEALVRRARRREEVLAYKDLRLYPRRMEAFRGERRLALSPKAFLLLKAFLEAPEEVLSKEALMRKVWGEEVEPATLEVHLSALRKALGEPSPIQTVRGYGYRLFLPEG